MSIRQQYQQPAVITMHESVSGRSVVMPIVYRERELPAAGIGSATRDRLSPARASPSCDSRIYGSARRALSGFRFQYQIERGLGRAAESCEPAFYDDLSQLRLPCLGTEGRAVVCKGSWHADHRRRGVEDPADRIQIIFHTVIGEGLHNHPGAVLRERLFHVLCRADRITHVMQTIEVGNEVVLLTGIVCRLCRCEGYILQACFLGPFACGQN